MEIQPQNNEYMNNPELFHPCTYTYGLLKCEFWTLSNDISVKSQHSMFEYMYFFFF